MPKRTKPNDVVFVVTGANCVGVKTFLSRLCAEKYFAQVKKLTGCAKIIIVNCYFDKIVGVISE